jgi:hypothetical protein
MLTGKAKEDFTNWFRDNINQNLDLTILDDFYLYPFSMQWGVYVDFFDGVDIMIQLNNPDTSQSDYVNLTFEVLIDETWVADKNTRYEAQIIAIVKANEIYNQAKNKAKTPHY